MCLYISRFWHMSILRYAHACKSQNRQHLPSFMFSNSGNSFHLSSYNNKTPTIINNVHNNTIVTVPVAILCSKSSSYRSLT